MTARVRYTADALYPEYKTARLETFGEDMTNQKRRIEDKLPEQSLQWSDEKSPLAELTRYELHINVISGSCYMEVNGDGAYVKFTDVERLFPTVEQPTGDLTDEQIDSHIIKSGVMDKEWPTQVALHSFARDVERAAISAHLARQPKAEQPLIGKLLDEFSALPVLWGLNEPGALVRHSDVFKMLVAAGKTYLAASVAPASAQNAEAIRNQALSDEVLSDAARDVLAERQRQVEAEGWHPDQDDDYEDGQLSLAAACYAMQGNTPNFGPPADWPWDKAWWKPTDDRRNLVKAGALILADIERIDRALQSGTASTPSTKE